MATENPLSLDELKQQALSAGYTKIQRDAPNALTVSLSSWNGFSSHVSGGLSATVTYYLAGNRVRVRKTLEKEDYWYMLS